MKLWNFSACVQFKINDNTGYTFIKQYEIIGSYNGVIIIMNIRLYTFKFE